MNYIKKIEESLKFIEDNLDENITLDVLAENAHCSKFHFHRIFHATVGQSVMEYIRQKKLVRSVNQLLYSDRSIIDIGMEAGFEYQQSYTRAFKHIFGFTPAECRNNKRIIEMLVKPKRLGYLVNNAKPDFISDPEFIEIPEFNIIGMEGVTTIEKEKEGNSVVFELWRQLLERKDEIHNRMHSETFIGICTSDMLCEDYIGYIACCEVDTICTIPKGMVAKTIPACKYAKFTHLGSVEEGYDSFDYIFGAWLINSEYELANDVDMILTSHEGNDNKKKLEILVPIKQ